MSDLHPATPTLQLSAALDRPLVHDDGDSVRFLVVEVTAPTLDAPAAPKAPLNLALVVDASGSMEGPPIAAAKEAARRVAGASAPTTGCRWCRSTRGSAVHVDGDGRTPAAGPRPRRRSTRSRPARRPSWRRLARGAAPARPR